MPGAPLHAGAAAVLPPEQQRQATSPKDLWYAIQAGVHALNGRWQPNLSGALRWCYSQQPPALDTTGTGTGTGADAPAALVIDQHARGPFSPSEMRRQWPALMADLGGVALVLPRQRLIALGLRAHCN